MSVVEGCTLSIVEGCLLSVIEGCSLSVVEGQPECESKDCGEKRYDTL